ncbi:MAG: HPP family protein, partial [Nannocystaceae bacterium]
QKTGVPVHEWELASLPDEDSQNWQESFRTVRQFMTTDLFTVRPTDIIDLAVKLMTWEQIRHIPVEDENGMLKGIVSHRELLKLIAQGTRRDDEEPLLVSDVMSDPPATVEPTTPTLQAIALMRKHRASSLPVVSEGKLLGLITGGDFMEVARRLLERHFAD